MIGWGLFVPVVAVLSGCWIIALAGMQTGKQLKYGRGTFSIMASGAGLITLGVAWYLFSIYWIYSLVVILLAIAALAIATP